MANIDLSSLLPKKFRNSEVWQEYLTVCEDMFGDYIDDVIGLHTLRDPWRINAAYLQNLATNIGMILTSSDTATSTERRKELLNAVDWIKLKGTYESLSVLALMVSFSFIVYDRYTNDYASFVDQEWFVGDENENPSGLDSSYYKSPHFGLAINLDRIYPAGVYDEGSLVGHLWRPSLFTAIGVRDFIERTRPVNTVPHYIIQLQCETDESGDAYEITVTNTTTKVVGAWIYSRLFFDGASIDSTQQIYFDESDFFDLDLSAFIASISKWKIGSGFGSGYLDLTGAGPYVLDSILEVGTVDRYTLYDDRIVIEFTVPESSVHNDINQVGLYVPGSPDQLMIVATFPDIHKDNQVELKFVVTINRRL
jgi:hypothetical protein